MFDIVTLLHVVTSQVFIKKHIRFGRFLKCPGVLHLFRYKYIIYINKNLKYIVQDTFNQLKCKSYVSCYLLHHIVVSCIFTNYFPDMLVDDQFKSDQ